MKRGDPFPIWGTCNGFELLSVLSSDDEESSRLTRCQSENLANPLHLFSGWEASEIYGSVSDIFKVIIGYPNLHRETKMIQATDIQTVIGNAGGYTGLFLGKLVNVLLKLIDVI